MRKERETEGERRERRKDKKERSGANEKKREKQRKKERDMEKESKRDERTHKLLASRRRENEREGGEREDNKQIRQF